MEILGREPLILDRSEAYIGVLIDDLVTKENKEPYRMMTSRAEYRLLLRQDNADMRLREKGYHIGLIDECTWKRTLNKKQLIDNEIKRLQCTNIGTSNTVQTLLSSLGSTPLKSGITLAELMARPECSYENLSSIDPDRPDLPDAVKEEVEILIKYDGYIQRQMRQVEQFKKMESKRIPENFDYDKVGSLRLEARQKLKQFMPVSIGQASRIAGVSPADISVLLVYLNR